MQTLSGLQCIAENIMFNYLTSALLSYIILIFCITGMLPFYFYSASAVLGDLFVALVLVKYLRHLLLS